MVSYANWTLSGILSPVFRRLNINALKMHAMLNPFMLKGALLHKSSVKVGSDNLSVVV